MYRMLGGWEDVQIAEQLGRIEQSQPEDVLALIDRITVRAEARPANADYALLLGEYYLSGNEPAEALRYYDRLIEAGATAPEILGKAAQSEFLSSGRVLSRRARARAEQALAVDPMQAAALATMGMAAFEEADYRQAIVYWQRLRDLEPPGSPGHDMLGQIIERAQQELGEPFPNRLPQQAWWSRSRYPGSSRCRPTPCYLSWRAQRGPRQACRSLWCDKRHQAGP